MKVRESTWWIGYLVAMIGVGTLIGAVIRWSGMNVWYGAAFTIVGLYVTYLAYGKAFRFGRSKT